MAAAACALGWFAPSARAQGQPTPQQMQQMMAQQRAAQEKVLKELGVTTAQRAKLKAVDEKYAPQVRKLQQQYAALLSKAQKETLAVLTPAQRSKLKAIQAAQAAQMQQRMGGR